MIDCIIFDIGNVLLDFNPLEYVIKTFGEEKASELHKQLFGSKEWLELDRGALNTSEVMEILSIRHPENKEKIEMLMNTWVDILTPNLDSIEILKELQLKNYKLLLLSNFHHLAYEHIIEKYDFLKTFHGGVISYKEKLLKPEAAIYECIIERYKLDRENTIFIDDTLVNVEGARNVGLKAIHFKSGEQLKAELEAYNVL